MTYSKMPRLGLKVGDSVSVTGGPYRSHCFGRVGVIREFLNEPKASNNGAALVEIMTAENIQFSWEENGVKMMGSMKIRPFIDTIDLRRA